MTRIASSCEGMLRLLAAVPAALALLLTPAQAEVLRAGDSSQGACPAGYAPGAKGVATLGHRAMRTEALTVTTAARGGDWDLAVFDRSTGALLSSSAGAGSAERVTVVLEPGQAVDVQACRNRGEVGEVDVRLSSDRLVEGMFDRTPAKLVRVAIAGPADVSRLNRLGLDVTHSVTATTADVIVDGRAQEAALAGAGFRVQRTLVPDLPAAERAARAADARRARTGETARALPSGRTTYRAPGDFSTDLKTLVDQFPGHVRRANLPGESLEGRPFEGVEIASEVGRPTDGRPIFVLGGLTHAREWPGGEMAIEFAIDLARSFGKDPRVTALLQQVRVFVFPILNPDGFQVSRNAGAAFAAGDDRPSTTTLGEAASDSGAYKRKNCRAASPEMQSTPCASRAPYGVDLNRAFSAYWGGDGSSSDPTTQQYRGPEPFTEPEAQGFRLFAQAHPVQVFITNHTFTAEGRILRQPGFKIPNDEVGDVTPDEARMKALGDEMAEATGGISELGYATLGNITGPSDDFLYYAQGTYSYTPELRGDNFHTSYASAVVGEYEGKADLGKAGRGWREAYLDAMAFAASTADHVVLTGTAPPGAVLRLRKDFTLPRSVDQNGDGTADVPLATTPEKIDATLTVPASGRYEWHVGPSKRPYGPAGEAFSLSCTSGSTSSVARAVTAKRGETVTTDFADCTQATTPTGPITPTPPGTVPAPPSGPPAKPGTGTAVRARASIAAVRFSAARLNRSRTARIRVVLRAGQLRGVTLRVLRGTRTVLRGTAATVRGRGRTLTLRRRGTLRAGSYRIVLTAKDASGRSVRVTRALRIRR